MLPFIFLPWFDIFPFSGRGLISSTFGIYGGDEDVSVVSIMAHATDLYKKINQPEIRCYNK